MAVNTTWSSPATASGSGGTDLAAGDTLSETVWDRLQSDVYRLGGTDGNAKTGKYQIGSTQTFSNAQMTQGLTIQQDGNDDQAFCLKSVTDVAHGMTSVLETDTYAAMQKVIGANGGLNLIGASEATVALQLTSLATGEQTTKNTTAGATIQLLAGVKSGAGSADPSATANVFCISAQATSTTLFIVAGDGDTYNHGGSTTMTTFDGEDDAALLEAVGTLMNPGRARDYRFSLVRDLAAHRAVLERGGVLATDPATGDFFISYKGMLGLLIDAVRQVTHAHRALEARVAPLLTA